MGESVSSQTVYNRRYIQQVKASGRREIRGTLADSTITSMYEELTKNVPKRQIGQVLSAMVKLAHQAKKDGELVIQEDGTVILKQSTDPIHSAS